MGINFRLNPCTYSGVRLVKAYRIPVHLWGYSHFAFKKAAEIKLVIKPQFIRNQLNGLGGQV